jgi:hypothetical protein
LLNRCNLTFPLSNLFKIHAYNSHSWNQDSHTILLPTFPSWYHFKHLFTYLYKSESYAENSCDSKASLLDKQMRYIEFKWITCVNSGQIIESPRCYGERNQAGREAGGWRTFGCSLASAVSQEPSGSSA